MYGTSRFHRVVGGGVRLPGPLEGGSFSGVYAPSHAYPPYRSRSRAQSRMKNSHERIGVCREQALKLVALEESEGCQTLLAVGRIQLGNEFPKPDGRPDTIPLRPDDLADQDQAAQLLHFLRLSPGLVAVNGYLSLR